MADIVKREESIFTSITSFEDGQRMAKMLATSNIIPQSYQNNIQNCIVAIEMANRIGISPLMVMQNLDVIQGKPSWRSTFIIAALNSCGRYKPLRFEFVGTDKTSDDYGCRAWTTDIETGDKLIGPFVTWSMVKAEGWLTKSGSKWKTMPELMFQYRAASFFGRLYAPDILNGMQSVEEVKDVVSTIDVEYEEQTKIERIQELFLEVEHNLSEEEKNHVTRVVNTKEGNSYDKAIKFLESKQ
jgi:hypothetical protein